MKDLFFAWSLRILTLTALFLLVACAANSNVALPTLVSTAVQPTADTQTIVPTLQVTFTPDATAPPQESTTAAAVETIVPTNIPILTPFPTPIIYTVQENDNPSLIAQQFGVDINELLQINDLPYDNALIKPGNELIIPVIVDDSVDLPLYAVKSGDTLTDIATQFGVDVGTLQQANRIDDPAALQVGQVLRIPISLGTVHYTILGDTLSSIAAAYDTDIDSLILENSDVLDIANPDFVPAGVLLNIPQEQVPEGYNCEPFPPRQEVITYTISNGEKLFCLERKLNLSITTLLNANPHIIGKDAVRDGVEILVPPVDGMLFTVSEEDIERGVTIEDIVRWYDLVRFDDVRDWQGRLVSAPLEVGQQLFIRNADLLSGDFDSETLITAMSAPPPELLAPPPAASGNETALAPSPNTGNDNTIPTPVADASIPPGALRPKSSPWSGEMTDYDAGFCGGVADGSGWTGALTWPVSGRSIREGRGFRPGHGGIDIEMPIGSAVVAAASGEVVWAGYSRWGGGNMVVLAHGNTWQTHYAHLRDVAVSCGQYMSAGTQIGTVGQTGASSFLHLHFAVRYGGFNYNPISWLP